MNVKVDADTLNVSIEPTRGYILYNGHRVLHYDDNARLTLRCPSCDTDVSRDFDAGGLHKWEAILYLLDEFDGACINASDDGVKAAINNVLEQYRGEVNDPVTRKRMKDDLQKVVPAGSLVDVQ